jgi:hypothetical protein
MFSFDRWNLRRSALALVCACLPGLLTLPAAASDKAAVPANAATSAPPANPAPSLPPGGDPFTLARAYQNGYLELAGAACYQLYTSLGIIATDYAQGHINSATAVSALDKNALLLGACSTSLEEISGLTPADDTQAQEILGRLTGLVTALGGLHDALEEAAIVSGRDKKAQEAAAAVNTARAQVETALEAYAKPL